MNTGFSLVCCTNIWTHYQASICYELARILGDDRFKMCLFEPVHQERLDMGWPEQKIKPAWLMGPPQDVKQRRDLFQTVCCADVAVLGAVPLELQEQRVATGKLTFIMSERVWKTPYHPLRMLNPRFARGIRRFQNIANRPNVHYLSMGAFAAGDVRRINAYGEKIRCWGYFAEASNQPPVVRNSAKVSVLWVGRMLNWKRVDLLLKSIALVLKEPNFDCLNIVGIGPEKSRLLGLARYLGLGARCVFHEPVSPDQVRVLMRQADIYVLPSNRHEGWGVVANEAMIEGAVLVANEQAGASRVLIDDNVTGFLFKDGDINGLAVLLRRLIANPELREQIRQNAWQKMHSLWHPRVGAERLLDVSRALLEGDSIPLYEDGPFSLRCTEK